MIARRAAGVLTLLLMIAAPAFAQSPWEVAGGYSYLQDPPDRVDFPAGWLVDGGVGLNGWLAVIGDISGHIESSLDIELSTLAILGGVRATGRIGPLVEFGQVLAGVVRATSTVVGIGSTEHDPALQPGVGLEYPATSRWSARVQFDYRLARGGVGPPIADPRHQFRYSAGIVYHGWTR